MDWPRKTTPNWHITYQNPYSGSKVRICKAHIQLPLKMVLPSMISIISSVVLAQILSSSLSLRSWPRHFKIRNIILKAPFKLDDTHQVRFSRWQHLSPVWSKRRNVAEGWRWHPVFSHETWYHLPHSCFMPSKAAFWTHLPSSFMKSLTAICRQDYFIIPN